MAPRLRHVLGIADMEPGSAEAILDAADAFLEITRRPVRKVPTLRGKTVVNLFFESSTRTRTSFELAGKRLSADVVNLSASGSSASKGESLRDTVATLDAMHADVIVIRHAASGAPHYVAGRTRAAVINAGDGMHEHPTQALLDAFTIRQHKGNDFSRLTVAICGDIAHSRVARSNALLLTKLGASVRLAGPRTLLPHTAEALGCATYDRIEPALEGADVVMMLRIQRERMEGSSFPTLREYARVFGLSAARLERTHPEAIVMHPGPLNRGVEIAEDVADGPRSVVLAQVESGVAVRMAVLYLAGTDPEHAELWRAMGLANRAPAQVAHIIYPGKLFLLQNSLPGFIKNGVSGESQLETLHTAILSLGRLVEVFAERREQLAESVGLSEQQWRVLEQISTKDFMPTLFARRQKSSPAAVSKVLRQLLDKGLISASVRADDGRQRAYLLTARGESLMDRLREQRAQAVREVWMSFDPARVRAFSEFSAELTCRLEQYAERVEREQAGQTRNAPRHAPRPASSRTEHQTPSTPVDGDSLAKGSEHHE